MQPAGRGYFSAEADGVRPGSRYFYRLEGEKDRPDPASRYQPEGVHRASMIPERDFPWTDGNWRGVPLDRYIIYELHLGTFTEQGTFEAAIERLDDLAELGVTAIELMPLAQFPGDRNWGYDGVFPFAVQTSYGGPVGLKRFVNACHERGLAVIVDVVYNHLGPEGNYFSEFGPYFTDRHRTPWGDAINFDGPDSDEVREFFLQNALYWLCEYHADALRLDAVHTIIDHSAVHFLQELADLVRRFAAEAGRRVYSIPESDLNDARLVRPKQVGGYGLDAQWNDDFHHAVHALLTGERRGYYADFGDIWHLVKAFREGFVYSGQYSTNRRRRHGNSSLTIPAGQLVVFAQNHDQIGNRMGGDRLSHIVSFEAAKCAAGLVLLSPFIPMIFMGEEHAETAPFQYFVSHSDEDLIEAVRRGRREEFAHFTWDAEPPDPQSVETFRRSKISHQIKAGGCHRAMLELYKELIGLRKSIAALSSLSKADMEVLGYEKQKTIAFRRWCGDSQVFSAFNLGETPACIAFPVPAGVWQKRFDSAGARWCGGGSEVPEEAVSEDELLLALQPKSFALFERRL